MKESYSESLISESEVAETKRNTVAVSFDDKYVYPFLVLAYSLKKSSFEDFQIVIGNVNRSLGIESVETIAEFCSLFQIDFEFRDFLLDFEVQTDSRFSIAAYGRLLLMENLQFRFLYLDVDTIAHPGWDQIFFDYEETLGKDGVAVIATIAPESTRTSRQLRYRQNQARQRAINGYFFSMILLIEPRELKKFDFKKKWREAARNYLSLGFMQHDQDVLNYLLHDKVRSLHSSYNHLHGLPSIYPRFFSSCVGHPKPWTFTEEDKMIATYTWALGNMDLGKAGWIEDFYAYWNYESALFTELSGSNLMLARKVESLKSENMGRFSNGRARLKFKLARIIFGR